jgi:hypothetical protein
MKTVTFLCALLLCVGTGATTAKHPRGKKAPPTAFVPLGEPPSPGKKPPRALPNNNPPGFMDDGARKHGR